MKNSKTDPFEIKNYLHLLNPSSKKGYFQCPVCEGDKLSIDKSGLKYTCYSSYCDSKKVAYKLRELDGQFEPSSNLLQVVDKTAYFPSTNNSSTTKAKLEVISKKDSNISESEDTTTSIKCPKEAIKIIGEKIGDRLEYNIRSQVVELDGLHLSTDTIRQKLSEDFNINTSKELATDTCLYLARKNTYDPVLRHLKRIHLNTEDRIDINSLAIRYFAREDSLENIYLKKWLLGAIARVFNPGCKFDEILILYGSQGLGKSSFFRIIGDPYFTDSMSYELTKDDKILASKNWIIELGEIDNLSPKGREKIKAYLSKQDDQFRPPYGRDFLTVKRIFAMCGSTNRNDFLSDSTGNRRYWIISPSIIELEQLDKERNCLLASLIDAYLKGENYRLEANYWKLQAERAKEFEEDDIWLEALNEFFEEERQKSSDIREKFWTMRQIFAELQLKLNKDQPFDEKRNQKALGQTLRKAGLVRKQKKVKGVNEKIWYFLS